MTNRTDAEAATSELSALLGEPLFVVMTLHRDVEISAFGGATHNIPLTYADGMVGALPVFATRESAELFAAGNCGVVEIVMTPNV